MVACYQLPTHALSPAEGSATTSDLRAQRPHWLCTVQVEPTTLLPRLERDTRARTVFRCRERPIYTPAGVQPATRDLLRAVNTWLGR